MNVVKNIASGRRPIIQQNDDRIMLHQIANNLKHVRLANDIQQNKMADLQFNKPQVDNQYALQQIKQSLKDINETASKDINRNLEEYVPMMLNDKVRENLQAPKLLHRIRSRTDLEDQFKKQQIYYQNLTNDEMYLVNNPTKNMALNTINTFSDSYSETTSLRNVPSLKKISVQGPPIKNINVQKKSSFDENSERKCIRLMPVHAHVPAPVEQYIVRSKVVEKPMPQLASIPSSASIRKYSLIKEPVPVHCQYVTMDVPSIRDPVSSELYAYGKVKYPTNDVYDEDEKISLKVPTVQLDFHQQNSKEQAPSFHVCIRQSMENAANQPHIIIHPSPTTSTNRCSIYNDQDDNISDRDSVIVDSASSSISEDDKRLNEYIPNQVTHDTSQGSSQVKRFPPQAFRFFMEQHVENVHKYREQRITRKKQLEQEMSQAHLPNLVQNSLRKLLMQKESNYLRLRRAKLNKSMFEFIKPLGVGAFGKVELVRKKGKERKLYALKTLNKKDILERNHVAHVKAERDILAEADNEWLVKLFYSFQDATNLYIVMEYVPGGDLMGLLIKFQIFDQALAEFYISELVLAIESVHNMGFIHRDVKPDNILIDRNGHIKLTDFGLCTGFRWTHDSKRYQTGFNECENNQRKLKCNCPSLDKVENVAHHEKRCLAHSLVGTPNYIAPEVLLGFGYTACCDWWSVGVILYEMRVGRPPFFAKTIQETQNKVINWRQTLYIPPEANLTAETSNLIFQLCCLPAQRLGANGSSEVKSHPFFRNISFSTLRKSVAPYVPPLTSAIDTSNFEPVEIEKHVRSGSLDSLLTIKDGSNLGPGAGRHGFLEFTFRRFFDDDAYSQSTWCNGDEDFLLDNNPSDLKMPVYV